MCSILVIDDDDDVRDAMIGVLALAGHEAAVGFQGEELLAQLQIRAYDLIITDMVMPGVDGATVIAAVRAVQPEIKILAVSGGGGSESADALLARSRELGADRVLYKPFRNAELVRTVAELCGDPQRRAGAQWISRALDS